MVKKKLFGIVAALACAAALVFAIVPAFAGTGGNVAKNTTTSTEYADLHAALAECAQGQTVELLGDVALSGVWAPVADFKGTFDGKNFTITGLQTEATSSNGLFASTNTSATVKNLTISGASIKAGSDGKAAGQYVGVLAGSISGSTISNVKIAGCTVTAEGVQYVGGLTGSGYPLATNCEVSNCNITGKDQVGGLVGYLWVGGLCDCKATNNTITAIEERAGGLIGKAQFASGNVGGSAMGNNNNTVTGGTVTAPDYAGGFAGQIMGDCDAYTINGNTIKDVVLNAPEISPIATIRPSQGQAFMDSLATKVSGNTWNIAEPATRAVKQLYGASDNKFNDTNMQVPVWVNAVCKIGNTKYQTLAGALADAKAGDTIEILVNEIALANLKEGVNYVGLTDESGKPKTTVSALSGSISAATIKNFNFKCEIESKTGNGTIIENCKFSGTGNALRYCYVDKDYTFVIKDCEFAQGDQYGIHFDGNGGSVVVLNSKITGTVAIAGSLETISFSNCDFAGRSTVSGHCNINIYNDATFKDCTFDQAYTSGSKRGILMLGDTDNSHVRLIGCSVKSGTGTLFDVFRTDYSQGIGSIDAAQTTDGKYLNGYLISCKTADKLELGAGLSAVQIGEAAVAGEHGTQKIYLVGKGAQGANNKLTAGKFYNNPYAYVAEGYKVTASGDASYPFEVVKKETPKEEVHEKVLVNETAADVSATIEEEDYVPVATAVAQAEVENLSEAVQEDEVIEAAKATEGSTVTDKTIGEASLIVTTVTVNVNAVATTAPTTKVGSLEFTCTPTAVVTTYKDGEVTGVAVNVPVRNDTLNGEKITVTLGCAGIVPEQVVHTSTGYPTEVFSLGKKASYEDRTFAFDEQAGIVTLEITHFSTIEVLGSAKYASVSFDANAKDAEGVMQPQGMELGKETALMANEFTREGYTFEGWNTKVDGTGTAYADKASITISGDVTLYAQWKEVVVPAPAPEPTPVPSTGDSAPLGCIALFALLAVAGLAIARKRLA